MEIRKCAVCGNEFTARNYNAKCCSDECRKKRNKQTNQKAYKAYQARKIRQAESLKRSKEHNLNRTLYNLHKYNEENGTRLSYGQYRAKIETGEIAI